jgi:hypothetical protein
VGTVPYSPPTLAVLLALTAAPALATGFVVTRYDDPEPNGCAADGCSLREAVIEANQAEGLDIVFLSAGTYTLGRAGTDEDGGSTGDLDVTSEVMMIGPGATMSSIDAAGLDRVLHLQGEGAILDLFGLTVRGGTSASGGNGILVAGGARLTVEGCEIRDNPGAGSGVSVTGSSQTTITDTLVTGNGGGGLNLQAGANAVVTNSSLVGNSIGEILIAGAGSSLDCSHCTHARSGTVLSVNGFNGGGTATLVNSIVSGSCSVFNGGEVVSLGGNVESTGDGCGFDQGSDQVSLASADLALGALGDNGGPTRTRMLGVESTVLGGASDADCAAFDQRGASRPDSNCDPGAVETGASAPPTPIFHDGFEQGNAGAWIVG